MVLSAEACARTGNLPMPMGGERHAVSYSSFHVETCVTGRNLCGSRHTLLELKNTTNLVHLMHTTR